MTAASAAAWVLTGLAVAVALAGGVGLALGVLAWGRGLAAYLWRTSEPQRGSSREGDSA